MRSYGGLFTLRVAFLSAVLTKNSGCRATTAAERSEVAHLGWPSAGADEVGDIIKVETLYYSACE